MKKITWLDLYKGFRKPIAPATRPHSKRGYSKTDRQRAKKEIKDE